MWVSIPGLGLETDQDHFFEVLTLLVLVLVLVLASLVLVSVSVSDGGLQQDLRLWATATLLVSKVEKASEYAPLFTYLLFDRPISMFLCIITFTAVQYSNVDEWKLFVCAGRDQDSKGLGLGLGSWSWSRTPWSW